MEELREHGDLESILKHYQEGTLSRWLTVWKHEGELEKINQISSELSENTNSIREKSFRDILNLLEIKYDETELSEYCKNNLVSSSATSGNGSGLSIKEKLTEFLPKDFSADFSAGKGLEDWEVTELQLDEDNVQVEFSCEKEDFYSLLKYKKDETLYKKVASMLVS